MEDDGGGIAAGAVAGREVGRVVAVEVDAGHAVLHHAGRVVRGAEDLVLVAHVLALHAAVARPVLVLGFAGVLGLQRAVGVALGLQETIDVEHRYRRQAEVVEQVALQRRRARAGQQAFQQAGDHLGAGPFAGVDAAVDERRGFGETLDGERVLVAGPVERHGAVAQRGAQRIANEIGAGERQILQPRLQCVMAAEARNRRLRIDRQRHRIAERNRGRARGVFGEADLRRLRQRGAEGDGGEQCRDTVQRSHVATS